MIAEDKAIAINNKSQEGFLQVINKRIVAQGHSHTLAKIEVQVGDTSKAAEQRHNVCKIASDVGKHHANVIGKGTCSVFRSKKIEQVSKEWFQSKSKQDHGQWAPLFDPNKDEGAIKNLTSQLDKVPIVLIQTLESRDEDGRETHGQKHSPKVLLQYRRKGIAEVVEDGQGEPVCNNGKSVHASIKLKDVIN